MIIKFSMDRIKNMDQLYTWTVCHSDEFEIECREEQYHGADYCKKVVADTMKNLKWGEHQYLGMLERIANEAFMLTAPNGLRYDVEFAINTYERKAARLFCTINGPEVSDYDQHLEDLKITLKDRLLSEWKVCTWLVDMQSAKLCREAYEKAFIVENNLRAFASKVLIHFLGVDWINRAGLEKEAESVKNLKQKFIQRVPEFDDINADFLSMTLETLAGVIFKGIVYHNDVILNRNLYEEIQKKASKNVSGASIADFIKSKRTVDKRIWDDIFVPFIDDPDGFKDAAHNFIEDRNHVAHSKVLSKSAYQIIVSDFDKMAQYIQLADDKFDREETSDEVLDTWAALDEEEAYEEEYYRERIANEAGIDILDEDAIRDWFDERMHDLYNALYQKYHLDVCVEISDFEANEGDIYFSVSCPVLEDQSLRVDVYADYMIDDDLGEDSVCTVECRNGSGETLFSAKLHFHNGNGYEGDEGIMEASEDSEYDDSELAGLGTELFDYIDDELNPYPKELEALVHRNKGDNMWTATCFCSQCGRSGISIDEEFLPRGKCCYCGYENELATCERCGELMNVDDMVDGFCQSCASYIEKQ
ncbi:MAG: hypothetical protein MJ116_03140 [Lachnospiraceae bacterium]|nr:hypothetical protein [Lachnospiraceae bacterium]